MFNIPNIPSYIQAPWEEEEWICPECFGVYPDVKCTDNWCQEQECLNCGQEYIDCECEGEE